jgi:hypothetical protein
MWLLVISKKKKEKGEHKPGDYEMVSNKKDLEGDDDDDKASKAAKKGESGDLTANQTIFLSAVTAYVLIIAYFLWIIFNHESYMERIGSASFLFKERYDYTFYLALASGTFCYFAYHFMIQAFATSSSTVILPLLQFPSVITLCGSVIQRALLGQQWLESYWHLLAYAFIFVGGLLPATGGALGQLKTAAFWKQPFVQFAMFSELSHGIYNLFIATVDDDFGDGEPSTAFYLHMEYFAVTRILYIVTFVVLLFFWKKMQDEVVQIKHVPSHAIFWTVVSEVLAFTGYFCSALAYQAYYQTGVVAASETSLNQLLNLTFAFLLKKYFGHGKKESTTGVPLKVLSAMLIMIGLYVAGGEGGH